MSTWTPNSPVYLDYQATTPTDRRVVEAMLPFFTDKFGNPHSTGHAFGWQAETAVEEARAKVADLIGAEAREIVFTSGATESNNLALKGVAEFHRERRNHVVTCLTEHKCVLEAAGRLEGQGIDVTYVPVGKDGLIDLGRLSEAIGDKTAIVSIMAVNNEIGVIQPLAEIGALCRARSAYFHTDAAQAVGKIPIDVNAMSIDLMSISGHKLYGPKGIGVLYVRRRPRVRLVAQIDGGGQERGMRSGTLAPPLCVGLGEACAIAGQEMVVEAERLRLLRDRLLEGLKERVADVTVNGDLERRIPGNLNVAFDHIDASALLMGVKDLAVSTGSACTSASIEPSYVLRALGIEEGRAFASLRIGLGRFTTAEEVDYAVGRLTEEIERIREAAATAGAA